MPLSCNNELPWSFLAGAERKHSLSIRHGDTDHCREYPNASARGIADPASLSWLGTQVQLLLMGFVASRFVANLESKGAKDADIIAKQQHKLMAAALLPSKPWARPKQPHGAFGLSTSLSGLKAATKADGP